MIGDPLVFLVTQTDALELAMLAFPRHTFFPETELLTGAVEQEQK
jgi:hypothetical protein